MRCEQRAWTEATGWSEPLTGRDDSTPFTGPANLVLLFGGTSALGEASALAAVREWYPDAIVLGCSTAGEILGTTVCDDSLVLTAIQFERTAVRVSTSPIASAADSESVGRAIARDLIDDDLAHVFVLSNGLTVNGSELVRGLVDGLPAKVTVTGGLAGDGARFEETLVLANGPPDSGQVAAVGFYGSSLRIGYGSLGGWDPFGPQRLITRADGNVLFELDGQPALDLYKRYLGEHAADLPSSGLLFPLAVSVSDDLQPVVRTILAVDEAQGSMTFAGDVPEGSVARLMKANFDRLIDGAAGAAKSSGVLMAGSAPDLAILISCVGRKLLLKQRVEEEVESVREVLGDGTTMTGFYSYGEISPFVPEARCTLHNQTMTITTFAEA